MKSWCNILPMWFIMYYSNKHGERFMIDGCLYTQPFKTVLIKVCK